MESTHTLFRDLGYIFVAAMAGGFLSWRLKLPLILGFVLGGIVISPFTPGLSLSDVHIFHEAAEVGVILLLFSIGVEFSIPDLMRVKWVAIGGGTLGIVLSFVISMLAAKLLGWSMGVGAIIGATVSVASTMVLAQLLADRDAMGTTYGRVMIGITLFEDLAVVLMTVVLPTFSSSEEGRFTKAAWTLGKATLLLVPLVFVAMKVIPGLIRAAKRTHNTELVLLAGLAVCLGTAAVAEAIGFSVAMGAFIAGLAISGSKDLHDVHDSLLPLRDAFIALFFVSLGALIDPKMLMHTLPLLGTMLVLIIVGKFIIWTAVVKIFGYSMRDAILVAAGLTQIGELSFVVVQTAVRAHIVSDEVFNATVAASLISIFLNVFIVRGVFKWLDKGAAPALVPAEVS